MDFEPGSQRPTTGGSSPPPLPPRRVHGSPSGSPYHLQNNLNTYGGYQPMYSQYNASPWNRSMYTNSNNYYSGYGPPGYSQFSPYIQNESNFQVNFESASRPAFEVIESVVHTVGSVSQLLDSTYGSLIASFRSILAVFDQFSRMRNQFSNLFSAFALIRMIRWGREKIRQLLSKSGGGSTVLQDSNRIAESAWSGSSNSTEITPKWPLLAFIGILIGGPYLTWKVLIQPSISNKSNEEVQENGWTQGKEDHFTARGIYDFEPENSDELRFKGGDILIVAPKERQPNIRGWLMATVDGKHSGLVPANRIQITGKVRGTSQSLEERFKLRPDILPSSNDENFDKIFE